MPKQPEFIGNCVICKKPLYRGDDIEVTYYYHQDVGLVCKHHPGAKEWYDELIAKANAALKALGVFPDDDNTGGLAK